MKTTKPSNSCSQKINFKQCISIWKDGASGEQVGEQVDFVQNIITLHETDGFSKKITMTSSL